MAVSGTTMAVPVRSSGTPLSYTSAPTSQDAAVTYTLYYSPGSASLAVHWMLIELGVPFEAKLVSIDDGAQKSPEYLRVNPTGRIPTMAVDGKAHGESAALLMLLAERHPEKKFAPPPGAAARADWLEMMIFLANTLLPAMRD